MTIKLGRRPDLIPFKVPFDPNALIDLAGMREYVACGGSDFAAHGNVWHWLRVRAEVPEDVRPAGSDPFFVLSANVQTNQVALTPVARALDWIVCTPAVTQLLNGR